MVSAYREQALTQEDIARWLDTRLVGTPASRIVRLARPGFAVIYTTGALATLTEWLNQGVPPILFVRTGDLQPHGTIDRPHTVLTSSHAINARKRSRSE